MARIFTSPATQVAAKAWMHDVMVIAGILPQSQRTENDVYFKFYRNVPTAEAIKVCDELVNRDFNNIDSAIYKLIGYSFYVGFDAGSKRKTFDAETAARAIVYAAECLGLYWDDTIRTPYEISEFQKTILGNAVYKYERYISAIKDTSTKARASAASSGTPKVAASTSTKNDFKQQGPKSGQARDLVGLDGGPGKPGEKVYIDKDYAFVIRGTKAGSASAVRAVVMPLNPKGAAGSTNKVFINSSHGYGVCECLFDEMDDAVNFYDQIVLNNRVPSDVTNLQVGKIKSDKNGYFLVGTEFGVCAVNAKVLNEEVDESAIVVEEDLGSGWKKATEGYSKEQLDELHSWMRKD